MCTVFCILLLVPVECTLLCGRGIILIFTMQLLHLQFIFFTLELWYPSVICSAAGSSIYSILYSCSIHLFFTLQLVASICSLLCNWGINLFYTHSCGIHLFFTLRLRHPYILHSAVVASIYSLWPWHPSLLCSWRIHRFFTHSWGIHASILFSAVVTSIFSLLCSCMGNPSVLYSQLGSPSIL
jgi:hypothetical protein